MRSANHSSFTSFGSQRSLGKFVVRSSTSTNSTSFVYRCGLRNDRLDMSESLKCFGFCGSRFRAWNCANFACPSPCLVTSDSGRVEWSSPRCQDHKFQQARAECPSHRRRVWAEAEAACGSWLARQLTIQCLVLAQVTLSMTTWMCSALDIHLLWCACEGVALYASDGV